MDARPRFRQPAVQWETVIIALRFLSVALAFILAMPATAADPPKTAKPDGNRLTYPGDINPWYPHKDFPDTAQNLSIARNDKSAVQLLESLAKSSARPEANQHALVRLHALYR